MYGLYGNLVQTFSTREQVSWRFLAKNQRSYTSPSVGGYRVRRWRWNVNSNERMWFKFKKASPSSKLGRRLERFFAVSFKFFSACVFINQHVYELCMIQGKCIWITATITFCLGERAQRLSCVSWPLTVGCPVKSFVVAITSPVAGLNTVHLDRLWLLYVWWNFQPHYSSRKFHSWIKWFSPFCVHVCFVFRPFCVHLSQTVGYHSLFYSKQVWNIV